MKRLKIKHVRIKRRQRPIHDGDSHEALAKLLWPLVAVDEQQTRLVEYVQVRHDKVLVVRAVDAPIILLLVDAHAGRRLVRELRLLNLAHAAVELERILELLHEKCTRRVNQERALGARHCAIHAHQAQFSRVDVVHWNMACAHHLQVRAKVERRLLGGDRVHIEWDLQRQARVPAPLRVSACARVPGESDSAASRTRAQSVQTTAVSARALSRSAGSAVRGGAGTG